jgi:hypothetical protein
MEQCPLYQAIDCVFPSGVSDIIYKYVIILSKKKLNNELLSLHVDPITLNPCHSFFAVLVKTGNIFSSSRIEFNNRLTIKSFSLNEFDLLIHGDESIYKKTAPFHSRQKQSRSKDELICRQHKLTKAFLIDYIQNNGLSIKGLKSKTKNQLIQIAYTL